jgi:hypothetical protein
MTRIESDSALPRRARRSVTPLIAAYVSPRLDKGDISSELRKERSACRNANARPELDD